MLSWKVHHNTFDNSMNSLRSWLSTFVKMDYNYVRHAHSMSMTGYGEQGGNGATDTEVGGELPDDGCQ
jgi:hypothetical protein